MTGISLNSPVTGSFAIDNVQYMYPFRDVIFHYLDFIEPFKLL